MHALTTPDACPSQFYGLFGLYLGTLATAPDARPRHTRCVTPDEASALVRWSSAVLELGSH